MVGRMDKRANEKKINTCIDERKREQAQAQDSLVFLDILEPVLLITQPFSGVVSAQSPDQILRIPANSARKLD